MIDTLKKGFSTKKRTTATVTSIFALLFGIAMAVTGNLPAAVPALTKGATGLAGSFTDENITAAPEALPETDGDLVLEVGNGILQLTDSIVQLF